MFDIQNSVAAARVNQSGVGNHLPPLSGSLTAHVALNEESALIGEFVDHCKDTKKLTTPNSFKTYTRALERFKDYLINQHKRDRADGTTADIILLNATKDDVDRFLGQFSKSSTFNLNAAALRSFYDLLVDTKRVENNPVAVKSKKATGQDGPIRYLTTAEQATLLKPVSFEGMRINDVRTVLLSQLVLATGQRASALVALKIEQVEVKSSDSVTIKIPVKGSKGRHVTFRGPVAEKFLEYLRWRRIYLDANANGKECPSVFFNTKTFKPIGERNMRARLPKLLNDMGISTSITFGDIRFSGLVGIIEHNMSDPSHSLRDRSKFSTYLDTLGFSSKMISDAKSVIAEAKMAADGGKKSRL